MSRGRLLCELAIKKLCSEELSEASGNSHGSARKQGPESDNSVITNDYDQSWQPGEHLDKTEICSNLEPLELVLPEKVANCEEQDFTEQIGDLTVLQNVDFGSSDYLQFREGCASTKDDACSNIELDSIEISSHTVAPFEGILVHEDHVGDNLNSDDNISHNIDSREVENTTRSNEEDSIRRIDDGQQQRVKKRVRRPEEWKDNKKKLKRNTGEQYTTKSGKVVQQRKMKETCANKCRLKCSTRVQDDEREMLFESFWKLANIDRQRDFIVKCMSPIEPKSKKEGSSRKNNFAYYIEVNDKKLRVCKQFYLNTFNISERYLYTSWDKRNESGIVECDSRGKHGHHHKLEESIRDGIRDHINSFPAVESHYLRAQTERKYLDGSLSIAEMHRLYKKDCEEKNKPFGKLYLYEKIFNTEFNISFFIPKKDQCSECEGFKNAVPEVQAQIKEKYELHIAEKNRAREEKSADILKASNSSGMLQVSVFDLQAVLPLPSGDVSSFYYKRKLSMYNFTVFDITCKEGFCYMWDESIGGRGANEIGSCVLKYLQSKHCEKVSDIIFYSDNCGGQNKNKYLLSMYLYALSTIPHLNSIRHKYLTTGHTQNEGDTMHSLIEKQKSRALKSGPIYIPSQMIMIVKLCKKTGKPYEVIEMQTDEFYDLKSLSLEVGKNFSINENGAKVVWNDVKEFKLTKENPHTLEYKTNFDEPYLKVDLRRKQRGRPKSINFDLKNAYSPQQNPKISKEKKRDLLQLCHLNHIPANYHYFYENLKT